MIVEAPLREMPHFMSIPGLRALLMVALLGAWFSTTTARAEDMLHAIGMHAAPQLPADFPHLPYANPKAPKGGRITLGALGSFDSLNPYIIRGVTPPHMRELVFESLLARNHDEPFSLYAWVAKGLEVPADRSSVTFHLDRRARFADGVPVTADDVLFSHALLKDKGWPYQRAHYAKVAVAEKLSQHSVRFSFAPIKDAEGRLSYDREMPLIMGLLPVLPKHALDAKTFEQTTLEPPLGSGPYRVAQVDAGRSIVLKRDPNWWGRDLAMARGRFNFDEVRIDLFRDAASLFEAFKAGDIDVRPEDDPGRWIEGYAFPAVLEGNVKKRAFATGLPSGMTAFAMNTRRPIFADARVRRAFLLMFDAEWINRSLYNGAFKRTASFFERSYLSAAGRPASAHELSLLAPFPGAVRPDVLAGTYRMAQTQGTGDDRGHLRAAFQLLKEAGYVQQGGRLVKNGKPLAIEFLAVSRQQERVMLAYARTLERLGIAVSVRQVDNSQYFARLKVFDFDVVQWNWSASLSPGNEQVNRWSSRAADIEGSLNFAGVRNPAADAMIDAMLQARDEASFVAAVRAFDRVLISGDYVIPLFHLPKVWVAHWSHLRFPERLSLTGYDLDTWWTERR